MNGEQSNGLYSKYIVTKRNGEPVDPQAEYLVLRIDNDAAARLAALDYADAIESSMPEFADDIRAWVRRFEEAR